MSKRDSCAELQRSRIAHSRDPVERRNGIVGIGTRSPRVVSRQVVHAVRDVERLHQSIHLETITKTERSAHTQVEREEVATFSRIARNEVDGAHVEVRRRRGSIGERTARRALQIGNA